MNDVWTILRKAGCRFAGSHRARVRIFCQASYACDLLEDILNRGLALEGALRCHQGDHGAANELENAVALFLEDVREASIRGRRARLFATDSNSERECERVSACNAEPEDSLAKIGGPLCPEVSVYDLNAVS